ncbi:hypothetical protein EDD11_010236 [Mortierella claussenii]|nr:hypothetical protein EDD11_010236 [Mortierella claussenii]
MTTTAAPTATLLQPALSKDMPDSNIYPSPSLSPAITSHARMPNEHQQTPSPASSSRRRSSVRALLSSPNPPASPLDALVMALEATVEEEEEGEGDLGQNHLSGVGVKIEVEDDDPDATIPSSPTMFMKRPAAGPSLHHLPTMMLPESVASTTARPQASGLAPSSLAREVLSFRHDNSQRKMSISSQDSSSSAASAGHERTKEYGCTIGSCEKKFYQIAHLRSHER